MYISMNTIIIKSTIRIFKNKYMIIEDKLRSLYYRYLLLLLSFYQNKYKKFTLVSKKFQHDSI